MAFDLIEPLGDRLVVRKIKTEEVSGGGIIMPKCGLKDQEVGVVEARGPNIKGDKPAIGDIVIFGKTVLGVYDYGPNEYRVMSEHNVVAILKSPE